MTDVNFINRFVRRSRFVAAALIAVLVIVLNAWVAEAFGGVPTRFDVESVVRR